MEAMSVIFDNNANNEAVWGAANEAGNTNATGFFNPSSLFSSTQSAQADTGITLSEQDRSQWHHSHHHSRTLALRAGRTATVSGVIRNSARHHRGPDQNRPRPADPHRGQHLRWRHHHQSRQSSASDSLTAMPVSRQRDGQYRSHPHGRGGRSRATGPPAPVASAPSAACSPDSVAQSASTVSFAGDVTLGLEMTGKPHLRGRHPQPRHQPRHHQVRRQRADPHRQQQLQRQNPGSCRNALVQLHRQRRRRQQRPRCSRHRRQRNHRHRLRRHRGNPQLHRHRPHQRPRDQPVRYHRRRHPRCLRRRRLGSHIRPSPPPAGAKTLTLTGTNTAANSLPTTAIPGLGRSSDHPEKRRRHLVDQRFLIPEKRLVRHRGHLGRHRRNHHRRPAGHGFRRHAGRRRADHAPVHQEPDRPGGRKPGSRQSGRRHAWPSPASSTSPRMAGGTGKLNFEMSAPASSDKIAVTGTAQIGTGLLGFNDFVFTDLGGMTSSTYVLHFHHRRHHRHARSRQPQRHDRLDHRHSPDQWQQPRMSPSIKTSTACPTLTNWPTPFRLPPPRSIPMPTSKTAARAMVSPTSRNTCVGTNPNNPDTDADGLLDGVETNTGTWVSAIQHRHQSARLRHRWRHHPRRLRNQHRHLRQRHQHRHQSQQSPTPTPTA